MIDIQKTINSYRKSQNENSMEQGILKAIEKTMKKINETDFLKHSIHADFKKELLTEDEYLNMKKSYSKEIEQLEKDILLLKKELEAEQNGEANKKPWIEELIEYGMIFTLDREIITNLIDKIYVSADKEVYVIFKHEEIFDKLIEELPNINQNFINFSGGINAVGFGN